VIVRKLGQKKYRDEIGVFLVEGEKLAAEIPAAYNIAAYIMPEGHTGAEAQFSVRAGCVRVSDRVFSSIADTVTPQWVIAVVERRKWTAADVKPGFVLGLENISDPGNVGALIRTAAAAGATGVLLSPGCADPFSPKAIRAAAGAALHLPVVVNCDLPALAGAFGPCYAADTHGGDPPYGLDMRGPLCLLIGSEAHGLSPEALAAATCRVCLPMPGGIESLNAAVAGSILIYEHVRQGSL
jgi:TrmH family RNA methyltransferase